MEDLTGDLVAVRTRRYLGTWTHRIVCPPTVYHLHCLLPSRQTSWNTLLHAECALGNEMVGLGEMRVDFGKNQFLPGELIFRIPANPHTSTPPWHQRCIRQHMQPSALDSWSVRGGRFLVLTTQRGWKQMPPHRCPAQTSHKAGGRCRQT